MKNGRLSVIRKTYLLLLLILGITMPSIAQGQVIDKIVGQIGNEIILLSDIQAQRLSMIQNGMEGNQATDCEILEEFLFEKLLVNQAKIDSVEVCGKTGTAKNPHGEDHSIFMAFAPKNNPKIAIAVYIENAGFGGTWAAPIASLMMEKYLLDTIADPLKEKRILEANLMDVVQKK